MPRVVIFADGPDWHCRRLVAAFDRRGAEAPVRSLRNCAFRIGGDGPGIVIPGFEAGLPDAVLVKAIAGGSFEQVTLRLGFLHALGTLGIPVINEPRAIERCVDKSMTSFLLHRAGIPTPFTLVAEGHEALSRLMAEHASDWVAKPLFGSQGRGLARLEPGQAPPDDAIYAGVHYLQRFVGRERDWHDYLIMVVGSSPVAAMVRQGAHWVTNVGRGARCQAAAISDRLAELSIGAVKAVGASYAGVDVIEAPDGTLLVLEVNSMPAWKGLQSVASSDVAQHVADHVLGRAA